MSLGVNLVRVIGRWFSPPESCSRLVSPAVIIPPCCWCQCVCVCVCLGILSRTLGVDPRLTPHPPHPTPPAQFQTREELHSLELSPLLRCQDKSCRVPEDGQCRTMGGGGAVWPVTQHAGDKRDAGALKTEQILFFSPSCMSASRCLL